MAIVARGQFTITDLNDGADGRGISTITNYYLATSSSSGVTTSTSGWTTTPQTTTTTKKYLWNYVVITYTTGSPTTSTPLIIGTHGATGSSGKGVKSTAVTYQASTSGTTTPTGTWSATIPTVSAGQFLWTRTVITYTDSTTSTSYSIGKMGESGQNGSDGKGVSLTEVTYQASTSGITIPTNIWTPTIPTVAAGSYLWTRTIITYTDNSTSTSYSIGKMGSNGSTGATGTGITSVTEEYYLSTSKTTQTGGTWVTSPPAWVKGTYLWTRNKIIYKNPTSTGYTDPVCDSSWEAVKDVEARVTTAEQKILPASIVATVKNSVETNGTPTFAQTSTVIQTASDVTYNFMAKSSGTNLIKNSDFKNGTYMWVDNGGGLTTVTSGSDPFIGGTELKSSFGGGVRYGENLKLKSQTEYVYEAWIYTNTAYSGTSVSPLHYWCMSTENTSGQGALTVLDYRQTLKANTFNKVYVHFKTSGGSVYFTPFIYGGPEGALFTVRQVSLKEAKGESAWVPHSSELYEGSTVIDGSGVTIKNGALRVQNNAGQTVLSGDSNGNLNLTSIGNGLSTDISSGRLTLNNTSTGAHMDLEGTTIKLYDYSTIDERAEISKSTGALTISSWSQVEPPSINLNTDIVNISNKLSISGALVYKGNTILNGSDTWLRTYGQTGWYNATYDGGMYMTDDVWVRTYANKSLFSQGVIRAESGFNIWGVLTYGIGEGHASRVITPHGYVDVGPRNAGWCHFSTDRDKFYFQKSVYIDGTLNFYQSPGEGNTRIATKSTGDILLYTSAGSRFEGSTDGRWYWYKGSTGTWYLIAGAEYGS